MLGRLLRQWMVPSFVERGSSYVDEDFGNASDLIANPTLDFFGKPVALSDRHVGIEGDMEVDPHHSSDPPTTYLMAPVHSGHATRHFGDFFHVPDRGIRENARSAPDNPRRCPSNDCRDDQRNQRYRRREIRIARPPTRRATAPETSVSLRIRAASACSRVLANVSGRIGLPR